MVAVLSDVELAWYLRGEHVDGHEQLVDGRTGREPRIEAAYQHDTHQHEGREMRPDVEGLWETRCGAER